MSDQDRISPYYIYTISRRQVTRIKKNINCGITNWSDTKFSKLKHNESHLADSKVRSWSPRTSPSSLVHSYISRLLQ